MSHHRRLVRVSVAVAVVAAVFALRAASKSAKSHAAAATARTAWGYADLQVAGRTFMRRVLVSAMFVGVCVVLISSAAAAQTMRRTPDGKPDLSGIWQAFTTANWDLLDHGAGKGIPAGQGVVEGNEIPYQPWAAAKKAENLKKRATEDPVSKCYLPGVPRITYMPYPFQIVQTPKQVSLLYEYNNAIRYVQMDEPHIRGPLSWWMGDSRGHWEGDTLVVDVTYLNDQTWFDNAGDFHSDALHLVERYTPLDASHINYEVTIDDPKVFTKPWKISMPLYKRLEKNVQLLEYVCFQFDEENVNIRSSASAGN
jgi:hypothetical protein